MADWYVLLNSLLYIYGSISDSPEPEEVSLKVDGKNDQCSRAEDVNFELIGFSVYGRVCTSVLTKSLITTLE